MKILFVCDTMGSGGAERVIATLSNCFTGAGHDVSILMLSNDADGCFYALDERIRLSTLGCESNGFFKKAKALKSYVISAKPDVVISFLSYVCIYTWWALRHTKIPYIVSERNDPNHRGKLKQLLFNLSFKRAAGCVFQTEDALNWYKKIIHGKGIVIYNPVTIANAISKPSNIKKQVLFVGRLTEQKNCFMLIDAFEIFSLNQNDYSLKIYGNGPLRDSLVEYIHTKGLDDKVTLLQSSKTWQIDERDTAMFVLPSKYEGMPNVLAEALCLGIPSVSTNCTIGGPKELKKLFPSLLEMSNLINANSLADSMERAATLDHQNPYIPDELCSDYVAQNWIKYIEDTLSRW